MSEAKHVGRGECRVVRGSGMAEGKQALLNTAGIDAETVGAAHLCLQLVTVPPGGRSKAHLHAGHETAGYVLEGEAVMWYGEGLGEEVIVHAGDFFFIPAGVAHVVCNPSDSRPTVAVIARNDSDPQERVLLLPELDAVHG